MNKREFVQQFVLLSKCLRESDSTLVWPLLNMIDNALKVYNAIEGHPSIRSLEDTRPYLDALTQGDGNGLSTP